MAFERTAKAPATADSPQVDESTEFQEERAPIASGRAGFNSRYNPSRPCGNPSASRRPSPNRYRRLAPDATPSGHAAGNPQRACGRDNNLRRPGSRRRARRRMQEERRNCAALEFLGPTGTNISSGPSIGNPRGTRPTADRAPSHRCKNSTVAEIVPAIAKGRRGLR
jgi:hypothetical protein